MYDPRLPDLRSQFILVLLVVLGFVVSVVGWFEWAF
jgi:hypothetical protein